MENNRPIKIGIFINRRKLAASQMEVSINNLLTVCEPYQVAFICIELHLPVCRPLMEKDQILLQSGAVIDGGN